MIVNSFLKKTFAKQIQEIFDKCLAQKLKFACAESCTGGLLSALFTEFSGISQVFEAGLVTYSNQAKINFLGVNKKTLSNSGAVSKEVAIQMAQGALRNCEVDFAIAITGIAGPNGGSDKKPVGLVYIAFASFDKNIVKAFNFSSERSEVRFNAVLESLKIINENI